MNGCNWQNKSFSVAVIDKSIVLCRKCNKETDDSRKYNGDTLCKECFSLLPSKPFVSGEIFNTDKDKQYEFTTDMFDGKPVDIHGKRHFKSLLKQHGLADASIKECRQEADFRKKLNNEDLIVNRKKVAGEIFSKNRELLRFRRR